MRNRKIRKADFLLDLGIEGIEMEDLDDIKQFLADHLAIRPGSGQFPRIKYDGLNLQITNSEGKILPEVTAAVAGYLIGRKSVMALTDGAE